MDDEFEVHEATRLALSATQIQGRSLQLFSAYSSLEAKALLSQREYACVLLDVVMETDDAGLKLVDYIRDELKLSAFETRL